MTLDADVASEIERIRKAEGGGFKRVLNDLLREAVKARVRAPHPAEWQSPIHPRDLGEAHFDVRSTSRALDYAEGDDHQ